MLNDTANCSVTAPIINTLRLLFVTLLGSGLSVVGLLNNSLIIYLFIRYLHCCRCHLFYLLALAVFDIIVEMCYVAVFSVDVLMAYTQSEQIYVVWHSYVRRELCTCYCALGMCRSCFNWPSGNNGRHIPQVRV